MSKICSECGKHEHHANGMCINCYARNYYYNNKKKHTASVRCWQKNNPKKVKATSTRYYRKKGILPLSENKECGLFLGVHVAERVLSMVFKNVVRQPNNNPGFDFVCNKGKKIDVKSSCTHYKNKGKSFYSFSIKKNKIADYFLCLAFDNRDNLNPLYMWLIPSGDVNHQKSISVSINTINKWDKYTLDINKVSACCNVMKSD